MSLHLVLLLLLLLEDLIVVEYYDSLFVESVSSLQNAKSHYFVDALFLLNPSLK